MWQRPSLKDRRKEFMHFIEVASSLTSSLNTANGLYFQPNETFIRG
jgi:hypothetical protein